MQRAIKAGARGEGNNTVVRKSVSRLSVCVSFPLWTREYCSLLARAFLMRAKCGQMEEEPQRNSRNKARAVRDHDTAPRQARASTSAQNAHAGAPSLCYHVFLLVLTVAASLFYCACFTSFRGDRDGLWTSRRRSCEQWESGRVGSLFPRNKVTDGYL